VDSKSPLVSVIINCYNGEQYLCEAIDSVLSQTYSNLEIILWDNQSTDKTAEIIKNYNDSRINYYYAPKHTLLYEARNYAIEKAKGEYLAFLDVDDWWSPEKLERQMCLFDDVDVGVVYSNFFVVNENKNTIKKFANKIIPSGYILDELLGTYTVGILTVVVRKKAVKSLKYIFNSRYHIIGDFDLIIRLSINWKIDCVQEPLAFYRLHLNNESSKHKVRRVAEMERWVHEAKTIAKIQSSSNFGCVISKMNYSKALNHIFSGEKNIVLKSLFKYSWSIEKIKLLIYLVLPVSVIKLIRQ